MRVAATKTMKIALAQINSFVGDIENNSIAIIKRAKEASKKGAELLITPELSICGYPPEDLVLREDFLKACSKALSKIAQAVPSIKVIVGHPLKKGNKIYNAASLLFNGKIQGTYFKKILPNYGVFDENRYFEPGKKEFIFVHKGLKIGLLICEDAWKASPSQLLKKKSVDAIIVINASPYEIEKYETRVKIKGSPDLQPVFPDMNREIGYIDFDKTSFQYEDISKKYTNASSSLLISQGNVIGVSQYVDTSSVSTNLLKEKGWIFFGDALMNKSERTEYNNSTGIMRLYANAWFPGVILVVSEIRKKGGGGIYGMHFDYEPYVQGTYTAEYAELTTFTYDPSIGEYNATFHQILKSMKQSERLAQINLLLYKYPDNLLALHTKYLIEKLMNDEVDANKTKDKIQKLISAK